MNLKDLIKEVERLNKELKENETTVIYEKLDSIKQTVEAVDDYMFEDYYEEEAIEDWQTLKNLLGLK